MMPVWQLDMAAGPPPVIKRYKAQCVRKDGHRADLIAQTDGTWSVYDLCCMAEPIGAGKSANLDTAQLLARLVWELSA